MLASWYKKWINQLKTPNGNRYRSFYGDRAFCFFDGDFLPSSTLRCFDFCRLFVNASFLRFKTWHYANFNIKYGVLSMNWWIFTWISVLIYLTFPAFHSCYLLYMGRARISKLCSSRCYLISSMFNIIYVKNWFVAKMSLLLRLT